MSRRSGLRADLARRQVALDEIDTGGVILDEHGHAWQVGLTGYWYRAFDGDAVSSFELAQFVGNFELLPRGAR